MVGAAAAAVLLCGAVDAQAACTVASNRVLIINSGVFLDEGIKFGLQMQGQWHVGDSLSGFFDIAEGAAADRTFPGDWPVMVDVKYSDKIRGWRDGGTVDVKQLADARAQQQCNGRDLAFTAQTQIIAREATTDGLDLDVELNLSPN